MVTGTYVLLEDLNALSTNGFRPPNSISDAFFSIVLASDSVANVKKQFLENKEQLIVTCHLAEQINAKLTYYDVVYSK